MNQAIDINTQEIIEAETLKYIYEDGLSEYQCIDESCGIKLTPCSYKPHNKNRPYFKSNYGIKHSKSCQFSAYLKMLDKAELRPLTEFELEDMPYPTKFEKIKKKENVNTIQKSNQTLDINSANPITRSKSSGDFIKTLKKSKVVSSISTIVDFYLKCPYNRDIELDIEGKNQAYMFWFKRIEKPILKAKYKGKRIFFGRLHTDKSKIEETETTLNITMYECEKWVKRSDRSQTKSQVNPFIISIDKTKLSKHKLTRLKNEMEYAIEEKIKAFKAKDEDHKIQAYVFFYGQAPASKDPYTFHVNDGVLVARYCRVLPNGKRIE